MRKWLSANKEVPRFNLSSVKGISGFVYEAHSLSRVHDMHFLCSCLELISS